MAPSVPTDRLDLAVNGLRLACHVAGDRAAPPMVLLHALGEDGADWRPVLPGLTATHRVYAPDLRGHGASDHPGRYSFPLMRDDVLAMLDSLDIDRCVLIGHSMGGAVALLVAEAAPHRLSHLVLEDSPAPRPGTLDRPRATRPDGPLPFDFDVVHAVHDQLNHPDPAWWDDTAAITVPTLVIGGGPDSHIPQGLLADLVRRLPDARLVTIPAGHLVHRNRPAGFLTAVRTFLTAGPTPG
jgi:pimeloyl-ACP methyl ester carboxylesterase